MSRTVTIPMLDACLLAFLYHFSDFLFGIISLHRLIEASAHHFLLFICIMGISRSMHRAGYLALKQQVAIRATVHLLWKTVKSIRDIEERRNARAFCVIMGPCAYICMVTELNMLIISSISIQAPFPPTNVRVTSHYLCTESFPNHTFSPVGACRAVKSRSRQSVAPDDPKAPRPSS